ncbi:MAG TPA: hypothetical protein VFV52_08380 [Bacilli bacterium]|nr:hypothetical protein [Bacilli bacterium]
MNKRTLLIAGLVALPTLGLLGTLAFASPQVPTQWDLLGMIRSIYAKNEQINEVNGGIVGQMSDINRLSDTTGRIGEGLSTLQAGVTKQDRSLARLQTLSQKQIDLSIDLKNYATTLHGDLTRIKQGSGHQSASVQAMIRAAHQLAQTAAEVEQTNATIAGKVDRAADLSAEVAHDMP